MVQPFREMDDRRLTKGIYGENVFRSVGRSRSRQTFKDQIVTVLSKGM